MHEVWADMTLLSAELLHKSDPGSVSVQHQTLFLLMPLCVANLGRPLVLCLPLKIVLISKTVFLLYYSKSSRSINPNFLYLLILWDCICFSVDILKIEGLKKCINMNLGITLLWAIIKKVHVFDLFITCYTFNCSV